MQHSGNHRNYEQRGSGNGKAMADAVFQQALFKYDALPSDRFCKACGGFGALGFRASDTAELSEALDKAAEAKRPAVIDCKIDKDEFVLPMLPPGGSIDDIITEIRGGEI